LVLCLRFQTLLGASCEAMLYQSNKRVKQVDGLLLMDFLGLFEHISRFLLCFGELRLDQSISVIHLDDISRPIVEEAGFRLLQFFGGGEPRHRHALYNEWVTRKGRARRHRE
jgi:hypothetical protein